MNRSILIVICDFLLVSLLAFSTVDINKVANPGAPALRTTVSMNVGTNQNGGRQDLGDVMRLALDEERRNRDALARELQTTKETASKQQADLARRETQIQAIAHELQAQQEQTVRLEQERTNLMAQMTTAQTDIENLNQQLHAASAEVAMTKEERAAMEQKARQELEKSKELQKQLAQLAQSNQSAVAEREKLSHQLQLAETEKQAATAQLAQAQDEVKAQRDENNKLTEGVSALATKSSELAREIHENTPQAANNIFEQFSTNRVQASFYALKEGMFGDSSRYKSTETVLATDGTTIVALCHVQDTPFTLWSPGAQYQDLSGTLARNGAVCQIPSLSFYSKDPRVALMPLTQAQATQLGCRVYQISTDPYKFQDAVVVGTRQSYYGECKFQVDLSAPDYLKMDHNSLKGLFGKFNPSSGDLVFSKNGQLVGVMANSVYCVMLHRIEAAATLQFGAGRQQRTSDTLAGMYSVVAGMPPKLQ
jgi:hypothetical protein